MSLAWVAVSNPHHKASLMTLLAIPMARWQVGPRRADWVWMTAMVVSVVCGPPKVQVMGAWPGSVTVIDWLAQPDHRVLLG